MRLDRHFKQAGKPTENPGQDVPMPLHGFVFGPMGMAQTGQWDAIYRLAYQRTVEAFRPTAYDRAMTAFVN